MKHSELGDCPECARIDRDFAKEVPPPIAKFDKGDLVEARVRWRIGEDNPFRMADWETELLYPMTVIERAQPELPTEEGIYFPHKTLQPNKRIVKLQNGEWCNSGGTPFSDDDDEWLWLVFKRGDLTKFEPVAETARKVLDAVINSATKSSSYEFNGRAVYETTAVALDEIGKEFGVQS